MVQSVSAPFLRRVLLFDAVTCLLMGVALLAFGGLLEQLLAIPSAILYAAAGVLLPFGAIVGFVGIRPEPPHAAVWWIVSLNALWAAASVVALVSGWLAPNTAGTFFVAAQAVAVAVIAELEVTGLRRNRRTALRA